MGAPRLQLIAADHSTRGSVLIIVMWICLGLVTLTLYFANSMSTELRAADNRAADTTAREAIAGGTRYANYILTQYAVGGAVPDVEDYKGEALPVGDAKFWFIGRDPNAQLLISSPTEPYYALVDEASKLNLNTVTSAMLQSLPLPGMTPELADAIVAWRGNGQNAQNLANTYAQLDDPRLNKGAAYETVDEVRLVYGAMLDVLLGEDTNRNGVLDPNEDDGETTAPRDDQNGALVAGLLDYVTVYSREPTTTSTGGQRINVTQLNTQQTRQQFTQRLTQRGLTQQRANQILARIPFNPQNPNQSQPPASVADFMLSSQVSEEEFTLIHADLRNNTVQGLVNVNTASEAVLTAIPGIGADGAAAIVSYRQAHLTELTSFFWLRQVLTQAQIRRAGPYITDLSYQFSADIAAVGPNGRGYAREKVIFDLRAGTPRIIFRQDLTGFGWALGVTTRRTLSGTNDT